MFLFTDSHVADEGFLELINNMLTSGMVPALYDDGEKDGLINGVRNEVCGGGQEAGARLTTSAACPPSADDSCPPSLPSLMPSLC